MVDMACKDLDTHKAIHREEGEEEVHLRSLEDILEELLLHIWEEGIHTVEEGGVLVEHRREGVSHVDNLEEEVHRRAPNVCDLVMLPLLRLAEEEEDAVAILPEGLRCVRSQDPLLRPKQRGEGVVPLRLPVLPEAFLLSRLGEQRRLPHFSLRLAER